MISPTRHGIPLLAAAMISFAGWSIAAKHSSREVASPPIAAPTNPYNNNVAGTGIVEPASEMIALAIERRAGLIDRVPLLDQTLVDHDDRRFRCRGRGFSLGDGGAVVAVVDCE